MENEERALSILNLCGNIKADIHESTNKYEILQLNVNNEYFYYCTLFKLSNKQSLLTIFGEEKAHGLFCKGERVFEGEMFQSIKDCLDQSYHFLTKMHFEQEVDAEQTQLKIAQESDVYYEDALYPTSKTREAFLLEISQWDSDLEDLEPIMDFSVQAYICYHALARLFGKEKTPKLINRKGIEVKYVEWVCLPKEKYFDGIHAVVYDEFEIYHLQDCYGEVLYVFRCDSGAKALEIAKGWLEEHGKTN